MADPAAPSSTPNMGTEPKTVAHRYVEAPHVGRDENYADGIGRFMVGRGVLKLETYRVVGFDQQTGEELRAYSGSLVVPLLAATELADILTQVRSAAAAAVQNN